MVTIVECDADIHKIYEYKGKFDGKLQVEEVQILNL